MSFLGTHASRPARIAVFYLFLFSGVVSRSQNAPDQQLPSSPQPPPPPQLSTAPQTPRTAPSTSNAPTAAPAQAPAQSAPIIPAAAERHYHAARMMEKDKNYDGAIEEYHAAIKQYPDYVDARYHLANLYMDRQSYSEAITELREVVMLRSSDANARNDLGFALKKTGDL